MLRNDLNPTLIFAENHEDPITGKILTNLIPKLKELGYECFFEESPLKTLEEQNTYQEQLEQTYQELNKQFVEYGLNNHDPLGIFEYASIQVKRLNITNLDQFITLHSLISENISMRFARHAAHNANKKFYEKLLEAGLGCVIN